MTPTESVKAWEVETAWLRAEVIRLRSVQAKYEEALQKIADMDYRGNRSTESSIAFKALETK